MKSLIFQAIDWYITDFYDENDDYDSENINTAQKKYLIKIFGRTEKGNSISVNITDYTPYFYIKGLDTFPEQKHNSILLRLKDYIDEKLPFDCKNDLINLRVLNKKDIWGFTNKKSHKFIRVLCRNYKTMRFITNLFTRHISIPGLLNKFKFKLYENNIEPYLRFIHKQDLEVSGWIKIDKYETSKNFDIKTGYNYNAEWKNVFPYKRGYIAPFIVASFDIECNSFDGSFPQASQTYNKVSYKTLEYYNSLNEGKIYTKGEKQDLINKFIIELFTNNNLNIINKYDINSIKDILNYESNDIYAILNGRLQYRNEAIINNKKKNLLSYFKTDNNNEDDYDDKCDVTNSEIITKLTDKFDRLFPKIEGDPIIQIGITTHLYGNKDCNRRVILTLGTCTDIDGIEVIRCKTEKDILTNFVYLINEINPDIITGYNIIGFDFDYIYHRARELGCIEVLCNLGKTKQPIKECECENNYCKNHWVKKTLSSSALGDNYLKYLNMEGRVIIDLMKEVQRAHNLDSYKLDYVAKHFINGKIKTIKYLENENKYELKVDSPTGIQNGIYISIGDNKYIVDSIDYNTNTIMIDGNYDNIIGDKWGLAKDDVSPQDIFECMRGTDDDRAKVARYCIQDCALCNYLMIKLEIVANNIGMSNVCSIPFSYIFLRGQSVKIFSLISKYCKENNFLIPYQDKKWKCEVCYFNNSSFNDICQRPKNDEICACPKPENEGYEGAIVLDPKPGIYDDAPISVLDYASLYPSSMISENISYDTIVLDSKYDNLPGYKYVDINYDIFKGKGDTKKKIGEQTCRFAQFENGEKGLLPCILQKLLKQRKATRKKITWKTITLKSGDTYKGNIVGDDDNIMKLKVEDKDVMEINKEDIENNVDTYNEFQRAVLDGLQLAYKVTANSLYGYVGAPTSQLFMRELAASTTATGRNLIMSAKKFAEEKYNCEVIYGDSVPFDEPVIIKNNKGFIDIKTLSEIFNENEPEQYETFKNPDFFFTLRNTMVKVLIDGYDTEEEFVNNTLNIQKYYRSLITKNRKLAKVNHKWIWYNEDDTKENKLKLINDICQLFKKDTTNRSNKEQVKCNYQIWTDDGWQKILRVIRHNTNKKIYRISSGLGTVDVTEDHSLCDSDKIPIKPNELKINSTKLLHYQFNDYEKLCEPAIVPEYPSLFYGDNIKQKHTKYDNAKKYDIKMNEYELDEDEAWVWGLFLGDGSCCEYRSPSGLKYSWAINNQSLNRLNRAKDILNKIEDMEFKILDTMESSHVYKLVPKGCLRYMVHKYRKFMYDEIKNKRVPMIILNASYSIRKAFFDGYYEADGTKGKEGKYIENEKEEKERGNWNLKYKKVDFTTKGKLTAQGLYILANSLGFNLSVRRWNKKDRIYSLSSYDRNHMYHEDRNIVKYIEEAINHEMDDGFVYDIETTTGRFAVGVGSIVALQTDSIFIKLPPLPCYEKYGHPTERQNVLQYNVDVGEKLSIDFQNLLKPPHCLEWEKMFYPFIIFSKKRYVGNVYEHDVNKFKQKSMGIVLKRRDNANIVKIIYGGIIKKILNGEGVKKSLEFLHNSLKQLSNGEYPLEELVVTKTLRGMYKNPQQIAHKVLADRMKKRDPGSAPQSNDRVPYIYVQTKENKNKKLLQGDKIEDPKYAVENKLIPDYGHYITNQIMKPCLQLYSMVLEELYGYKHINDAYHWKNKKKSLMEEKQDVKKVDDKIKQLREKEVEELLFSKYLTKIDNKKNGVNDVRDYFTLS